MKKILSLLALVLMSCMGAWAQTSYRVSSKPISQASELETGIYALSVNTNSLSGFLFYYDSSADEPFRVKSETLSAFSSANIVSNNKYLWKVTRADDGSFSVQNVANNEFLSNKGASNLGRGNMKKVGVNDAAICTSFHLGDSRTEGDITRWLIYKTQDGIVNGSAYPYVHTNAINPNSLSYWEGGEITSFTSGSACKVAFYPVEEGNFDNAYFELGKVYRMQLRQGGDPANSNFFYEASSGKVKTRNSTNASAFVAERLFYFKKADGGYTLHNIAAGKEKGFQVSSDNNSVGTMTTSPTVFTLQTNSNGGFTLKHSAAVAHCNDINGELGVWAYGTTSQNDLGSMFTITEITDADINGVSASTATDAEKTAALADHSYDKIAALFEAPSAIETGIYEIKNVSNEGGVGRGYLIDYTGYATGPSIGDCQWTAYDYNTKHPTNRNDGTTTTSYWYVYANNNGTAYVFSLSALSGNDWPKFLNVSATGSWSDTMVALDINPNTSYANTFSIRNHEGGDNDYLSMACATNSTDGAIKRNGMSDGGDPLVFIPVSESSLNDDQRYIMNYGLGLIAGTSPIVRVSDKKNHSFQINCNGGVANYLNPFTFPTQTEEQRGVFQFYRSGETAKVKIKEMGSGKFLAYSNANEGKDKIALVAEASASEFVIGKNASGTTTIYTISPATNTNQGFNWHGGVNGVDSPYQINAELPTVGMGFYANSDSNSKWRLNELTGEAATTAISNSAAFYLTTYKNKALAYNERIRTGLGYYNYNGGNTTGYVDAVEACQDVAAVEALIATIDINQPVAGSFIRFKGGVSNEYVDANALADQTNRAVYVGMSSDGEGAGSIWYLDNNKKLISFSKGYYITNTCEHSGTESNASSYIFEASNSTVGRYYIHTSGAVFYDNGSPANRNCLDRQGLGRIDQTEKWTLEEVTTLPVALTQVGDLAYASFNAPVAVTVPSGVTAYGATINGNVLELTAFEGTKLAANTPVILTAKTGDTYNFDIVASGAACSSDLKGTVAKQNVAADKTTYVLNKKGDKIGFYTSDTFINGFKAYCETEVASNANALSFRFDDVLTAIEAIQSENSGAEVYDLQGRRLTKAQKGMNIINGHKVLVK